MGIWMKVEVKAEAKVEQTPGIPLTSTLALTFRRARICP